MAPWDKKEAHEVVEHGKFYRCVKCGKMATAADRLSKTRCSPPDKTLK